MNAIEFNHVYECEYVRLHLVHIELKMRHFPINNDRGTVHGSTLNILDTKYV